MSDATLLERGDTSRDRVPKSDTSRSVPRKDLHEHLNFHLSKKMDYQMKDGFNIQPVQ